jgi:hypothetical protein
MTFIPREPVLEMQYLKHDPDSSSSLPIEAGRLVRLVGDKTVDLITDASAQLPVGFLMQKIKDEYTDLPTFARFRSDMGSSDAFKGDAVGVASLGVWETDQYVDEGSDGIDAGTLLYCDDDGKLSDTNADSVSTTDNAYGPAALALNSLTASQTAAGTRLLVKCLL